MRRLPTLAAALVLTTAPLAAQQGSLVYLLGKDTLAVEQWTRSATAVIGEMAQRNGPAVVRVQYSLALGRDGRPTRATITRLQGDGSRLPNAPLETRFTVTTDSVVRELAFADSTQRRAFAARGAMINFPVFVYGPTEVLAALKRAGTAVDSVPALGLAGGLGFTGLEPITSANGTVTTRMRGAPYAMVLTHDARDRLVQLDGSFTTNKVLATRGNGGLDVAGIAKAMKPTGALSARADARAGFGPGAMVVVDYGRPLVRERTVWGGTLVPMDSIWRAGANDATHLFTTRALTLGATTLAPGSYTLWVQHTATGTFLIVSKQVGQWGTQYDPTHDMARVSMELKPTAQHVEEFTITVSPAGPGRGQLTMAWGDREASVQFGVSATRP
jgi:hypothetical protein